MAGETDLKRLLEDPRPTLDPREFVFCCSQTASPDWSSLDPWAVIREAEGTTLLLEPAAARSAGFPDTPRFRRITLNVHSSLEAVGFLAAMASRLAEAGISVNPIAGFYHDHLFVPADRAEQALALLRGAADAARAD